MQDMVPKMQEAVEIHEGRGTRMSNLTEKLRGKKRNTSAAVPDENPFNALNARIACTDDGGGGSFSAGNRAGCRLDRIQRMRGDCDTMLHSSGQPLLVPSATAAIAGGSGLISTDAHSFATAQNGTAAASHKTYSFSSLRG